MYRVPSSHSLFRLIAAFSACLSFSLSLSTHRYTKRTLVCLAITATIVSFPLFLYRSIDDEEKEQRTSTNREKREEGGREQERKKERFPSCLFSSFFCCCFFSLFLFLLGVFVDILCYPENGCSKQTSPYARVMGVDRNTPPSSLSLSLIDTVIGRCCWGLPRK